MNACVGASGASHHYLSTENGRQRLVECLLHTVGVGLYLPSVVVGAVVGKEDEIPHGLSDCQVEATLFLLVLDIAHIALSEVVEHLSQHHFHFLLITRQVGCVAVEIGLDGHEAVVGNVDGGAVAMA